MIKTKGDLDNILEKLYKMGADKPKKPPVKERPQLDCVRLPTLTPHAGRKRAPCEICGEIFEGSVKRRYCDKHQRDTKMYFGENKYCYFEYQCPSCSKDVRIFPFHSKHCNYCGEVFENVFDKLLQTRMPINLSKDMRAQRNQLRELTRRKDEFNNNERHNIS